jgi:CubicO group peptidase (beta-lactamase class C family)
MAKWLDAALDYIPSWLELQLQISKQPGFAIAIVHDDKIVLERAYGYADCSRREPLTPQHRFRAASHSKSFTSTGVLKLAELRKLRLQDPVKKYISEIHPSIGRLTIAQLLCHGGGVIRDGNDCGYFYGRQPFPSAQDLLADFQAPTLIKPNTRFKYSNQGYGLLGLVIEAVTGEGYAPWLKRNVIDAAGLRETTPDFPPAHGAPLAQGHTDDLLLGERVAVPGDYSTAALAPASGVVSTAGDLALFYAQLSPRAATSVLSARSRREMLRSRLRNLHSSAEIYYGLGVVNGKTDGWDWFGHTGGLHGYVSRTRMFPRQDLTICVLANSLDAWAEQWIAGTIHVLQEFKRRNGPTKKVKDWTDRWWGLWGAIDLVPMGDAVLVANPHVARPFLDASRLQVTGRDKARITASSGFLYFAEGARRTRNEAGEVSELWLGGDKFLPQKMRALEIAAQLGGKSGNTKARAVSD